MKNYPLNVTLDTNIFEAAHFDFNDDSDFDLLLKNIEKGRVNLVLSDIVIKEVEQHISDTVSEIYSKVKNTRKEILKKLPEKTIDSIGFKDVLNIPDKSLAISKAKEQFFNFIDKANAELLDVSSIELKRIVDDYFEIKPPFQDGEKKRKEFPDAFIAAELKKRFHVEAVIIITSDKGLKAACESIPNKTIYSNLSELFDFLSKKDVIEYTKAASYIKDSRDIFLSKIEQQIDDSIIEVNGISYDRKGEIYGHEYDETMLEEFELMDVQLHSIDDIDGNSIAGTMRVNGRFVMDCYYDDYDNAYWDSEIKEYLFVERILVKEIHNAKFACRFNLNMETNEIFVLPFRIMLGGDSRIEREEVE